MPICIVEGNKAKASEVIDRRSMSTRLDAVGQFMKKMKNLQDYKKTLAFKILV